MIARLVLALMLMTFVVDAQSQPPAPGTRESKRNPPQSQPAATQQQPQDLRGTEQSPAVIRVVPVPKSQEEAAQEQADRADKATANRWTMWLAGLTVLVGAGQILMIWRQAVITERQNQIMERQSTIMNGQLKATETAANAAAASTEIARRSMVLMNRAYVDVSNWTLEHIHPDVTGEPPTHFIVGFKVGTASQTPALIEAVKMTEPADATFHAVLNAVVSKDAPLPHHLTLGPLTTEQQKKLLDPGDGVSINIFGRVRYRDVFNQVHHRRFARVFAFSGTRTTPNHQFMLPDDPELNAEEDWGKE